MGDYAAQRLLGSDSERDVRWRRRLDTDLVAWLTVVSDVGVPQPAPVWFLWRSSSEDVLIYSQPTAKKLVWLEGNDNAALHLVDDGGGHNYVVLTGSLRRAEPAPPGPDELDEFLVKYRETMDRVFGAPGRYADMFSVPLVFTPRRVRGD